MMPVSPLATESHFASQSPVAAHPTPLSDAARRDDRRQSSEVRSQVTACWSDLHRRAVSLTRNEDMARDLVQDTLERALRFESQYEPGSNLKAWLYRILLSVFITRCRRTRRERRAIENLTHDPCAWTSPDQPSQMKALSSPVARAVAALPPHFRQALELVDVADLSYRDAADVIGVPLGTVMSRLHRGRRLLATALRDAAATPELPKAA
ncbi:MAG TPA: sigma-70 family RNA polymerase sigma factor [Polyangiaceae bacterium]|nr:sigma-70 family RNA polymerase sigma factor [Polyangiaceae bacterium]